MYTHCSLLVTSRLISVVVRTLAGDRNVRCCSRSFHTSCLPIAAQNPTRSSHHLPVILEVMARAKLFSALFRLSENIGCTYTTLHTAYKPLRPISYL